MALVRVQLPFFVPAWLHPPLKRLKDRFLPPPPPPPPRPALDLAGAREVEWSFVAAQMPRGPGDALDFACETGYLSIQAAQFGFRVVALDLQTQNFPWSHSNIRFLKGDILDLSLPEDSFDLVINCSSVEHVGLAGRYDVSHSESDGDLQAMSRLRSVMKRDGVMILTVPCGLDAVVTPFHRVYGAQRLPLLLEGYLVEKQAYWIKGGDRIWRTCQKEEALAHVPTAHPTEGFFCSYALACFVLRKSAEKTRQ